ncbi:hypothetical protein U1Q18_009702 [Sarracenia purpurea var. burkii]
MADSSHLERMGRELKCPICLSLLNSTVSLTCNHVFCNSCIEKSMKSASSCPVCKVPYRRREIRPAPHMDSLVSIYKSMEVASGFNIFVTQNLPLTKLADEENQSEGGRTSGRQKRGKTFQSIQQNHRGFKGKRSKQSLEINQENLNLDPVKKPSFPRKKRVQVPQCPPSETPVQPAMFEVGLGKITEVPPERGPGVLKEMPAVNEKGESIFTPFFWLRDEDDVEKLTQMTDGGHNMDISPPNAPCFSDIKDSDDEIPSKVPPKGEANITFNDANYFDSEMFEWTQRPCSPELCSSPPKIQVTDREEFDGSQIKESKLSTQAATTTGKCEIENIQNVVPKLADNVEVSLTFLSSPRIDNTNGKDRMKRSKNRSRKACKRTVKKQENRTLGEVLGAQAASYKMAKSIIGEKKHGNNVNSINSSNRTRKGEKEVVFGSCAAQPVSENFSGDKTLSAEANGLNLNEKTNVTNLPASSDQKETSTKIVVQRQSCHLKRLKIKTTTNLKCDQEQTCKKKKKISTCDDMSKDNKLVNGIQDGCTEASVKNTQQVGKFHCNSEIRNLQDSLEKEKIFPSSSRVVLHKCETVPNKNQCVFCHSTENSEVADREEFDGSQIKESKLSTQAATTTGKCEIENTQNVVPKLADNVVVSLTFWSFPRIDNTNGKDRMKRSKNRSRKACKRTVKKQENRTLGEVLGAQAASYKMAKSIIGEKKHGNNVNSINSSNRTRKGEKEVVFGSCAAEPVSENFSALSAEANGLNLNEKTNVTNLPASSDQKKKPVQRSLFRGRVVTLKD